MRSGSRTRLGFCGPASLGLRHATAPAERGSRRSTERRSSPSRVVARRQDRRGRRRIQPRVFKRSSVSRAWAMGSPYAVVCARIRTNPSSVMGQHANVADSRRRPRQRRAGGTRALRSRKPATHSHREATSWEVLEHLADLFMGQNRCVRAKSQSQRIR